MTLSGSAIVGIVTSATVVAVLTCFHYGKRRWIASLKKFKEANHGYKTKRDDVVSDENDVLLMVNPASGEGKAQARFAQAVAEFEKHGRVVEVYVTSGSEDVRNLSQTKDLSPYKCLAFLSGDSTITECLQLVLTKHGEKWPYAPILPLPGGSSNVLSADAFGDPDWTVEDTIDMAMGAGRVKRVNLIKCTADGATTRYATIAAFSGFQKYLIENLDSKRHIQGAFGGLGLAFTSMGIIFSYPCRKKVVPHYLSVFASDTEGGGKNLNFGVSRWEGGKLTVVHQIDYPGFGMMMKTLRSMLSGELGAAFQKGDTSAWGESLHIEVGSKWTAKGGGPYEIIFDGSPNISLKGEEIEFEVVAKFLPMLTKG